MEIKVSKVVFSDKKNNLYKENMKERILTILFTLLIIGANSLLLYVIIHFLMKYW